MLEEEEPVNTTAAMLCCSTATVTTVITPIAILVSKLPEAFEDCSAATVEKWIFFFVVVN